MMGDGRGPRGGGSPPRRPRPASNPGAVAPSAPRPGSTPGVARRLSSPGAGDPPKPDARPPLPSAPSVSARRAPGEPAILPLGARIADAYLALAALAYLEVYTVGLLSLQQFVGPFELGQASQGLVPVALLVAAPAALCGGAVVELLRRAEGPRVRVAVAALAAAFTGVVGFEVAGGRHLQGGLRVPFAAALAIGCGMAAFAIAPKLARRLVPPRGARKAALFLGITLAALVLVDAANVRILPRLYPAFHLALGGVALLLGAVRGSPWAPSTTRARGDRSSPARSCARRRRPSSSPSARRGRRRRPGGWLASTTSGSSTWSGRRSSPTWSCWPRR